MMLMDLLDLSPIRISSCGHGTFNTRAALQASSYWPREVRGVPFTRISKPSCHHVCVN